jgi:hypothetical protein
LIFLRALVETSALFVGESSRQTIFLPFSGLMNWRLC